MNLYNNAAHFGEMAGEEAGAAWKDILNLLYELLGNWTRVMNYMKYPNLPAAVDPGQKSSINLPTSRLH